MKLRCFQFQFKYLLSLITLVIIWQSSHSQCTGIYNVGFWGPTPSSLTVQYSDSGVTTGSSYYIEYGLLGFTPGTTASPGIGGIILSGPINSSTVIYGLAVNTTYDVYVRKQCSNASWSLIF